MFAWGKDAVAAVADVVAGPRLVSVLFVGSPGSGGISK
jgi:hypothetical protein